jgi:hypothetical protein
MANGNRGGSSDLMVFKGIAKKQKKSAWSYFYGGLSWVCV